MRITGGIYKVQDIFGLNSTLPNGEHILMWDFDNVELATVIARLKTLQAMYNLPNVYIMKNESSEKYHAYSLRGLPFRVVVEILASTNGIDLKYLGMGCMRGYFTLRVSQKDGFSMYPIHVLPSQKSEDVRIQDLKTFSLYETRKT